MRWTTFWVVGGLLSFSIGCDSNVDRARQDMQQAEQRNAQVAEKLKQAAEVHQAPPGLAAANAQLERNAGGEIVAVDLRGIEATDVLAVEIGKLSALEKLTITDSAMSLEGWKILSRLTKLQQLDVRDCQLDNDQLAVMIADMKALRALKMNGQSGRTTVDDTGLAAVARCPELKALAIDHLWVTVEGIKQLANNQKLVELYAAGTAVDDAAVALLAQHPKLRKVRLSKTAIGTEGLEALSALPLEELDVSESSGINDESLAVVGTIKTLKRLNLWRDTVSDDGVGHLAGLTELEWLNLDNTHLADGGLRYLADMQQLTFLHLGSTGVTDAGMPALVGLKSLKDLKVTRTAVTEAGVEVVKQAIPGIDVQLKYIDAE